MKGIDVKLIRTGAWHRLLHPAVRGLVKWRAVEFRLLLFYCLLLLALGGLFSMFTVVSFDRFEKEALRTDVEDRAGEIWTIGGGLLNQPEVLRELLERRFSPEMQNRFIRLSTGGHVIYQSGPPVSHEFDPRACAAARADRAQRTAETTARCTWWRWTSGSLITRSSRSSRASRRCSWKRRATI